MSKLTFYSFGLFLLYIVLSLLLGEEHPFSRYPMYNSFPNTASVYFLKDKKGHTLALQKYFNLKAEELGHLPPDIAANQNISYDSLHNTTEGRKILGARLLHHVMQRALPALPFDTLQVWRKEYTYNGKAIQPHELLLYAGAAQ